MYPQSQSPAAQLQKLPSAPTTWQTVPSQDEYSVVCSHCDSLVSPNFNYCNSCGSPVPRLSNRQGNIQPQNSYIDQDGHDGHRDYHAERFSDEAKANLPNEDVCKFHLQGNCRHGSSCKFSHDRHSNSIKSQANEISSNSDGVMAEATSLHYQQLNIDETMVLTVIQSLGLIVSAESVNTVRVLLTTLRHQCVNSEADPVAAQKARAALKALLSANEVCETSHAPMAAEGAPSRNLYVHGFGPETDESAVEALFSLFCEVKCVVMKEVLSRSTGLVEGRYCFVWTSCLQQASKARNALDKFNLNGNILQVNFAKERNSPLEEPSKQTPPRGASMSAQEDSTHCVGSRALHIQNSPLKVPPPRSASPPSRLSQFSNPPSRNLFVANLSDSTTSEDIERLFTRICEVKRVVMKSAGYCFVWTGGVQQAVTCISALNGYDLKGHCIQVAFAKDKDGRK